jgi:transposase-like protein
LKVRLDSLTKSNDEDIARKHKISPEFLQKWISKYSDDHKVTHILRDIEDLADQVLVKQQLKEIHFHLPE